MNAESAEIPPTEPGPIGLESPPTKWPTVIGVISLVYACLGMLCAVGIAISSAFTEWLMELARMNVEMPPIMKIIGVISAVLMLGLGILMIVGSVRLMRRMRTGVKLLQIWALLRVGLLVLGIVLSIFMAPTQLAFERSMHEARQQRQVEAGHTPDEMPSDAELWRSSMIAAGVRSALWAIYPVFIIFYLSRRKIAAEVQTWP